MKKGKVIAIVNNKGGVAKTTTTLNLGACLAKHGLNVLLIDTDPQANLSSSFGIEDRTDNNLGEFLIKNNTWEGIIHRHKLPDDKYIDIVPAARQMQAVEKILFSENNREKLLKKALEKNNVRAKYDYTLIDCGPNLGTLTSNALCAADEFIIPFEAEYFSYKGTATILEYASLFQDEDLNPNLKLAGIVITRYNENIRGKQKKEFVENIKSSEVAPYIFKTQIRTNIKLMESPMHGMNIFDYDENCNGATDYYNLTTEFLEKQNG